MGNILHRGTVEIAREREHQRDLHHLGRLDLQRAERDPALRAQTHMAHGFHRDQKQQCDGIGRIGKTHPDTDIDKRDHDQDHQKGDRARKDEFQGFHTTSWVGGGVRRDTVTWTDPGQRAS